MASFSLLYEITGHTVAAPYIFQGRSLLRTDGLCIGTTAGKLAAGGGIEGTGYLTLQNDLLALGCLVWIGDWDGGEERLAIGVEVILIQFLCGATSTRLPRYMTPTRSEICRTMDRSWATNR